MYTHKHFSDDEVVVFADAVKKSLDYKAPALKTPEQCIARALCAVGSCRSHPFCGTYVSHVRETLARIVNDRMADVCKETIISYCVNEHVEKNIKTACDFWGNETLSLLEELTPALVGRKKRLADYL